MPPLPHRKPPPAAPLEPDDEYVIPERIVVDDESFARLTDAILNPREPNEALIAVFKKP